ncbi:MAG TPA: 2-oxo acid dehydrogenase subunit E2 [Vicinamibacterales bacterium]|nr:2-oxo acid dehydrogenase subunit E2 [Vicinamibacterales bacterium]
MATDFTLPELGEQIEAGDVLRVLVKPGDTLTKDQAVLELETDKATIEVPSSVAGVVKDIKVKAGDKVKVGQAILSVEEGAGAPAASKPQSGEKGEATAAAKPAPAERDRAQAERVPDVQPAVQPRDRSTQPDKAGVKDEEPAAETPARGQKVVDISRGARPAAEAASAPETPPAPAAPSVRRTARELGVEIDQVTGTGPDGRISVEDVKAHVKRLVTGGVRGGAGAAAAEPLPDFSRWGEVERQPMRAVRRKTAEHLSSAWATIPHVTQNDLADITALDELRKKFAKQTEDAGGALTVTAIAVKVVAAALKVFSQFNASIDMAAGELVVKKYINVGVAVDTDRGLLVPVIRDADTKNITQLSVELAQLAEKARTRKITLDEMQGGCFSISNLGGIGGTSFTPIVNAPEVAILGISRARMEPVYQGGQFVPRLMLPLSLSYDHRVIDGADGIRFLRWVVEAFEQPFLLALQG